MVNSFKWFKLLIRNNQMGKKKAHQYLPLAQLTDEIY